MKDETIRVLWISTLLVLLEAWAIYNKINGTNLALAIAALAGLGGYALNSVIRAFRGEKDAEIRT